MKLTIKLALLMITAFFSTQTVATQTHTDNERQYQALVGLMFDAIRVGDIEVVERFISAGFPVNQRNGQSYTPLMLAAYQGDKPIVSLLLAAGADPCLQDKRGNTAIMGALLKREVSIAKLLYQADCSPQITNKAGLTLAEFAELYGQSALLDSLSQPANEAR